MQPVDPAADIVLAFIKALKQAFNPDDVVQPPVGGGSKEVWTFAGDGALPDAQLCKGVPWLWVRLDRRYRVRKRDFPAAYVGVLDCKNPDVRRAVAIEIGVARCTTMEANPKRAVLEDEATIGLDDSWRIALALCMASDALTAVGHAVVTDTVAPVGPEGGMIAWTGMSYVQY